MVFYIRKEKIEMHKQFDQVVALCIGKNFVQAICTCACTTCALVQYIEENDRNAATIWSMGVCCQFKAGLASPQPFLFTHSPLTVNGDHIKDEEEEEKTPIAMTIYCSVCSDPPTMMMIITMTPQQTKTVDPGGIQRPRTRCGTQTSSFAPGPSPLPFHLLNQPLHVSLFLFLQLDHNI